MAVRSARSVKLVEQTAPQSIPAGLDTTRPLPPPARCTETPSAGATKDAAIRRSRLATTSIRASTPIASPDQVNSVAPGFGRATTCTRTPSFTPRTHSAGPEPHVHVAPVESVAERIPGPLTESTRLRVASGASGLCGTAGESEAPGCPGALPQA